MTWVGVDLDGTLAQYDKWRGVEHIGHPHEPVRMFVLALLDAGIDVRVFTARCQEGARAVMAIELWCQVYLDHVLPVTDKKDMDMVLLLDDRAWNPWGSLARGLMPVLPSVAYVTEIVKKHWDDPQAPPKEFKR